MNRISLDSIDICELLDDMSIDYDDSGKNVSTNWIGTACPFCDDDSNHLGINLDSLTITCWKCGTKGTVIKYFASILDSYRKACSLLEGAVPRELKRRVQLEIGGVDKVTLPDLTTKNIRQYIKYVRSRGFNAKKLFKKYDLRCSTQNAEKFGGRIIVPIYYKRRLVTFTSVDPSPDAYVRYKHCPDAQAVIPIKDMLYGMPIKKTHSIIVVEGLMDKWRMGDGCVCTFGTNCTADQVYLLSKFQRVKILFDGDKAGRIGAENLGNKLSALTDVKIFDLPDGVDPDQLSKEDVRYVKES